VPLLRCMVMRCVLRRLSTIGRTPGALRAA